MNNSFGCFDTAQFFAAEDKNGLWLLIELHPGKFFEKKDYVEFIERKRVVSGCPSEKDALATYRHYSHGIDLGDKDYYERTVV